VILVQQQKPRFWHIALALAVLAFIFLAAGWNLPLNSVTNLDNYPTKENAHKEQNNNVSPTLGLLVEAFLADLVRTKDGLLVIFTGLLAIFTFLLFRATNGLLRHAPQVERAYISGGGVPVTEIVRYTSSPAPSFPGGAAQAFTPVSKPTGIFELHINNYGKTPGELTQIGIGFCEAFAVPPTPDYTLLYFQDWIGPGVQGRPLHRIPIPANFSFPAIYGRFYYRDIFGASHSSGFILAIELTGTLPVLAPSAYTDAD
jgi:hypothetical protein